jgi:hypothetical protein
MKTELFKKLIKEAVREVLREELLTEAPVKQVPKVTKYEQYIPPVSKPVRTTGNPIADLMAETKATMFTDPGAGHYQDISQHVSAPGLGMESTGQPIMMEESFARPEPGLDISQFDFVKNAAAVFKASQEKDKQRFGG